MLINNMSSDPHPFRMMYIEMGMTNRPICGDGYPAAAKPAQENCPPVRLIQKVLLAIICTWGQFPRVGFAATT
ncbi:MAG: hypothetical protein IJI57_07440 [Flexilinea sp.]|nr:hypothetical protein [Flexilinea sp.]